MADPVRCTDRPDDATLDEVRRLHEAASNNFDTYTVVTTRSLGAVLAEVRAGRATETAARAVAARYMAGWTSKGDQWWRWLHPRENTFPEEEPMTAAEWALVQPADLRAALSAASTEPDHAPFPPEHRALYYPPERVLDEAVTVESNERWYAASGQSYLAERVLDVPPGSTVQIVLSGSAASAPTDEPEGGTDG